MPIEIGSPTEDLRQQIRTIGIENGVTINVQGTYEDPLFEASHIGLILDIPEFHDIVDKDFGNNDKIIIGNILFLTEVGLYRILPFSTKTFAESFSTMAAKTIFDIVKKSK